MGQRAVAEGESGCMVVEGADTARAGVIPDLPLGHMPRHHLIEFIERPYHASLTLVVAEAGSGKTTLAAEWVHQTTMPVGWITFDGAIADEQSFVCALRRVVQKVAGVDREGHGPAASPPNVVRDDVIGAIRELDRDVCIVIDNWEAAPGPGCAAIIESILAVPESSLKLMLIGRTAPDLRLGRLRSFGRVRTVVGDDLHLSRAEAEAVLRSIAPADLPARDVARIAVTAEGWVAGVVFQGLAVRHAAELDGTDDDARRVQWEYIDEYVGQELLAPLRPELRNLVLSTCWLPWVGTDVNDVMLERTDSARALSILARQFPFLRADSCLGRYRYHQLVRESLCRISRNAESADLVSERGRRAAAWLIGAGEFESAARIALDTNVADAADLISPWFRYLADRSDFDRLRHWLEQVPNAMVGGSAEFVWWRIVALIEAGHAFETNALVDAYERQLLPAGNPLDFGRVWLARGWLASIAGRDTEARGHLGSSVERLPADAYVERMYASTLLGESAFRDGRDAEASAALKNAETCAARLPIDERWSWFVIGPGRANGYALRGDLYSAITKYRLMLAEIPPDLEDAGIEGFLRCRLVSLFVERCDLGAARHECERIDELIGHEPRGWHRDAMFARASLLLAEGRRDEAEEWASEHLKALRRLPEKTQMVNLLARIWLERGEYPLVESWLADVEDLEHPWIRTFGHINHRILAINLDLLCGRFERAALASERLASEAIAMQRWPEAISLSARWAVALHHLGHTEQADAVLRGALERGAGGGFVRAFHVPGFDTVELFADVWPEQEAWLTIRRHLKLIHGQAQRGEQVTISPRELEVLRFVAEGRTNQQIAATMFISANTVRNHLVRIGQRLEARNRQEAVARARDLGLLS